MTFDKKELVINLMTEEEVKDFNSIILFALQLKDKMTDNERIMAVRLSKVSNPYE